MAVREHAGFIAPLEGLRGVAVAWVVLFHYAAVRGAAGDPWVAALQAVPLLQAVVGAGYLGVDLFFVLSAFLLSMPWLDRSAQRAPPPGAGRFWARRIRRIVPAYYVQLALLFALFLPLLQGIDYWRRDLYVFAWNGVAHGLFLHTTSPLTAGSMGVNGALWTLAVEAQFYLLAPLLLPLFARAPRACTAAAVALAVAWHWAARHGLEGLVAATMRAGEHWQWPEDAVRRLLTMQFPAFVGHFALGALGAHAWLGWRDAAAPSPRAVLGGGAAAAALLLAALLPDAPFGAFTWLATTFALAGLLLAAALARGALARLLASKPVAFTGRVSYSAYLYHLPLLYVGMRYAGDAGVLFLPAYLAATLGVAWVSWRCCERKPEKL